MKILYVSSEVAPFAASGGLGDVMGALPKTISALYPDDEVSVVLPLYDTVKPVHRDKLEKYSDISFKYSWRQTGASIYRFNDNGVNYFFIENHYYFERGMLYGCYDDAERFAFFCTAVIEFMLQTSNVPDILHANDWQAALSIVYLKTEYSHIAELCYIKTVYTIHNIEYQGKFDPYILGDVFALDSKYYNVVEFDGCINLMKAAIVTTDYITTVSPHYAHELSYSFFGFGLEGIISENTHKMTGVINGIDYSYFSPDHGGEIDFPFNKENVKSGKEKNKIAICEELGLDSSSDIPLLIMITRLASQKGVDLLLHISEELLSKRLQLVVLGTGDSDYEQALKHLESRHANFRALIKFDRIISKRLYASADMFLMPSKFEPCGLAQMICCSYATIPIVRAVGGLYDTIIPYGMEGSNGFNFSNYNAHDFLYAIERALDVYSDVEKWHELRERAINCDFTWDTSAQKYMKIYNNLLNW